jgi:hypothetical protein
VKKTAKKTKTKSAQRSGSQLPRAHDAIRIVPLHLPSDVYGPAPGIAGPAAAKLTYRGGPLLDAVEVFTIFWGSGVAKQSAVGTGKRGQQFFQVRGE